MEKKKINEKSFFYIYKGVNSEATMSINGEELIESILEIVASKTEKYSEDEDKDFYLVNENAEILIQIGYNTIEIVLNTGDIFCVEYLTEDD